MAWLTALAVTVGALAPLAPVAQFTPAAEARPLAVPVASVSLDLPAEGFIGEDIAFTVTFDNGDAVDVGYGPYIDLYLPLSGVDGTASSGPNDGLSLLTATYLGSPVALTTLNCPSGSNVTHPLTGDSVSCPAAMPGYTGPSPFNWQLNVIQLPFGSFTNDQPPAPVLITSRLSNRADLGVSLVVRANGGFMFGADPLDNPGSDPVIIGATATASITPTLLTLQKIYIGPEDETATGPNFPRQYRILIDIAAGQTITSLLVTDVLSNNVQFLAVDATLVNGGAVATTAESTPSLTVPGGTLAERYATATGTTAADDVELLFSFYIPLDDNTPAPVLPALTGDDALSLNEALAVGSWQPIDPRDAGGVDNAVANPAGPEHILEDQSIAIQKGNSNLSDAVNSPGDIIEYTLAFQISDFFAFQNVIITDTLSDGQRFVSVFTPTLSFDGNTYTLATTPFDAANYTVDVSNIGNNPTPPTDGSTVLYFRVSDELMTKGFDGRMVGGCVPDTGTGGPVPDCGAYNDGGTVGTITYRTQIQEDFSDTYPSGDPSVDQGDVLTNTALIDGSVLGVADATTPTGFTEADDTGSGLQIAFGALSKTIYAVNGVICSPQPCTGVQIAPAYTLTYRLVYELPISDFEDFSIVDYLPLPVFFSTELTTFDPTVSAAVPPAGTVKFGPDDTFYLYTGSTLVPTMTVNATANSVAFDYGDYDNVNNQATTVDLLLTVTASDEPFADQLFLTNQARAAEGSTNAGDYVADAIVQITLTQPVVRITKGLVGTNNPESFFSPGTIAPAGAGSFTAPGDTSCPRFSGTITSPALGTNPINSDLHNVDQLDLVTFGIVVENIGTGLRGAFDVVITDTLPISFHVPAGGLNLCVTNGAGQVLATTGFLTSGLEFVDPAPIVGALTAYTSTGTNLAFITFDLEADALLPATVFTNTTAITNLAGIEGGPNHITTTTPGRTDVALLYNWPLPDKRLISTEIVHPNNLNNHVVIGEVITYQLDIRVPEGNVGNLTAVDLLDNGLAFMDLVGFQNSNPGAITHSVDPVVPAVSANGRTITFTFGTVTNTATTNPLEETFTLTYTAVTINVSGNQTGTMRNNLVTIDWDLAPAGPVTDFAPNVRVVEPTLAVQKNVSPGLVDSGDVFTYQIILNNVSRVDAFDAVLTDDLPFNGSGSLILDPTLVSVDDSLGLVTSGNFALTGSNPTSWALSTTVPFDMLVGPRLITLTITGTAPIYLPLGTTITNTALVRWTSLPGDVSAPLSIYSPDSVERTGADGPGTTVLNNYAAQDPAAFATTGYRLDKLPVTPANYTIGELVTYTIVMTLPEGVTPGLIITDALPSGLNYLGHTVITMAAASGGALAFDYSGNLTATPLVVISPSGLEFNFGDVTTDADNDGSNNAFAIQIVAQVANSLPNQIGTVLTNTAEASLIVLGNRIVVADPTPVVIEVVEPVLALFKTMPNFAPGTVINPGDTVTFTVIVAHTGASQVPAYDVVITDVLQSDYINITVLAAQRSDGLPLSSGITGQEIRVPASPNTFDLPLGLTAQFTYTAQINPASTSPTLTNSAYTSWTTLPGLVQGERTSGDGFVDDGSLNDYLAAHGVFINIGQPTAIELARFEAAAAGDTVTLTWETAVEIDTAGFNLYRAATLDGPRTQVNALLIAATGGGGGAVYSAVDQPGLGTWYYWLEDVDTAGADTLHGPVTVTVGTPANALHRIYLPQIGK